MIVSSHTMMALLIIVGYVTIIVTIAAAILEAKRMDRGKGSLMPGSGEKAINKKWHRRVNHSMLF